MEVGFANRDIWPTETGFPSLCQTCVYRRFVSPAIGRSDMPRLRGRYYYGHSEEPCNRCSCNCRFRVFYVPRMRVRQLKGFKSSQREITPTDPSQPLEGFAGGCGQC
jgi:hypothetical protein